MLNLFSALMNNIKDKNLKATLAGVFTFAVIAVMSVTGYLAIDNRYAHASEVTDLKAAVKQQSTDTQNTIMYSMDSLQRSMLMEKVLEIEEKAENKRTELERSRLNRLRSQINDLDRKWDRTLRNAPVR